ncbi:MAG TPA: hypothetical protein VLX68_08105 [Chitinivibrionales bacterium]|nr:hypothetical protein [Chitinivibrionales bacterium]
MEITAHDQRPASPPEKRIDYMACFGVACLLLAILLAPLFVWKTAHVRHKWNGVVAAVQKNVVPHSAEAMFLKDALAATTVQYGKASMRAMHAMAMEIEMTLAVAGVLLLWFRVREIKREKKKGAGS